MRATKTNLVLDTAIFSFFLISICSLFWELLFPATTNNVQWWEKAVEISLLQFATIVMIVVGFEIIKLSLVSTGFLTFFGATGANFLYEATNKTFLWNEAVKKGLFNLLTVIVFIAIFEFLVRKHTQEKYILNCNPANK